MKPGFHAAGALWHSLKLLVLASWQGYYSPINPKINPYLCLDMTYPPAKFDVDWSKETQTSVLASWQGFYSPTDPKINPHVSWYHIPTCKVSCLLIKKTQGIVKKILMFDARPPTDIPNLMTRFHLVKAWWNITQLCNSHKLTARRV